MNKDSIQGHRVSPQQKRIWGEREECVEYRVEVRMRLRGEVEGGRLREAMGTVVKQYGMLRTRFQTMAGMGVPLQVVDGDWAPVIEEHDLRGMEKWEQEARIAKLNQEGAEKGFELDKGPLLRVQWMMCSESEHVLWLCMPAICGDARTMSNMARALREAYAGESGEEEGIPYDAVAEWLNEALEDAETEEGRKYWERQELSLRQDVDLPFRKSSAAGARRFRPGRMPVGLTEACVLEVGRIAERYKVSVAAMVEACWRGWLWRVGRAQGGGGG